MELRAVLLDLDNTLFDHRASARAGLDAFLDHFGTEQSDKLASSWFQIEQASYNRFLTRELSFQEQRRERLRQFLPLTGLPIPKADTGLDQLFSTYLRKNWLPRRPQVLLRLESRVPKRRIRVVGTLCAGVTGT